MSVNVDTYAIVNLQEIRKLQEASLSGFQTRVYMVLCSFANNEANCFPSLKTIADSLGMACKSASQQVLRALKRLEDVGLIKRNSRRSKSRFEMLTRRAVLKAKSLLKNQTTSVSNKPNKECLQKQTTNNRTNFPSISPQGEKKKRKTLFSKFERRQRRAQLKNREQEQRRAEEQKRDELRRNEEQDRHRIAFLNATDTLISTIGRTDNKSIIKLAIARINYEYEPSRWGYEPPKPSLTTEQKRAVLTHIRTNTDSELFVSMYEFSYGMEMGLSGSSVWKWVSDQC